MGFGRWPLYHVLTTVIETGTAIRPRPVCDQRANSVFWRRVVVVLFQFDTYVKSLNIEPQAPMFRIVTDGQLPIRQCLHREASIKDIELPEYYNVFHDLRKDFSKFYNAPQEQTFGSITDLVICILLMCCTPQTACYNLVVKEPSSRRATAAERRRGVTRLQTPRNANEFFSFFVCIATPNRVSIFFPLVKIRIFPLPSSVR